MGVRFLEKKKELRFLSFEGGEHRNEVESESLASAAGPYFSSNSLSLSLSLSLSSATHAISQSVSQSVSYHSICRIIIFFFFILICILSHYI